ncbi:MULTISPECIES: LysR family transcriptional regulator [Vibrio]|uniref:LysR family transcriptional regulator n=1 Tax=Vibrio genomosp. F6 str. FF-238 TaxID=1191298 RepID=A0A1E5DC82_9VIBR|nr:MULTISPECIES: LysR family transcriptional regulator [Vibrio]NOH82355.1 LysR family transcriptional regulator [Vibrio sp. 03-59-1]OEE81411.1 LysR family transcriptional regulator [Vibrio genomosp. F6 str. FF-238]RBW64689.1 LysR family transcriptional regulator [Vibrionales bacterium C3R12]
MEHKRIQRLMLFVELARQLNFTKAAQQLGISKGYLSEQIKLLEKELQCPLLIRTTRSVRLTQEGEHAYAQGLAIRSQVIDLERNIIQDHNQISGLLRLTAPKMFAETYLFELCAQFRSLHPDVQFEINSSYTTFNLNQQEIDLAFRATNLPPDNMVAVKLFPYQHVLVASPEYLSTYGIPEQVSDLEDHQCLTTLHQKYWPLKNQEILVNGWISTNENHLLKKQALAGKGIVRIAKYYVEEEIKQEKLSWVLPLETLPEPNHLYLLYPQVIYPSLKLKTFITFVRDYFSSI